MYAFGQLTDLLGFRERDIRGVITVISGRTYQRAWAADITSLITDSRTSSRNSDTEGSIPLRRFPLHYFR